MKEWSIGKHRQESTESRKYPLHRCHRCYFMRTYSGILQHPGSVRAKLTDTGGIYKNKVTMKKLLQKKLFSGKKNCIVLIIFIKIIYIKAVLLSVEVLECFLSSNLLFICHDQFVRFSFFHRKTIGRTSNKPFFLLLYRAARNFCIFVYILYKYFTYKNVL